MIEIISIIALIVLDQLSKYWAVSQLKNQDPMIILDKVFQFTYVENKGAAFGFLSNKIYLLVIVTVVIMSVIFYFYRKIPKDKYFLPIRIAIVFIIAGALGNFIDRVRLQYVIDMFYFNLIDFPVWNVADMYITCSSAVLVILMLFKYKDEDFKKKSE